MSKTLCRTLVATMLGMSPAIAGQTWTFDVNTSGQDVSWTSPTSVDPAASVYEVDYNITLIEADVIFLGIPFNNINVTSQIPPDLKAASIEIPGPAPVQALNQMVVVPPPPDPPAFAATLSFGLNATGFGFASATNVTLGTLVVNLPVFGNQTVTLTNVRIVGQLTIHGGWYDLGHALAGSTGTPVLSGSGALKAGTPVTISLTNAAQSSPTLFVVGLSQINVPFEGGIMVPSLDLITTIPTDANGSIVIPAVWPAAIPPNLSVYMQYWVLNSTSTAVNGASNGLRAVSQ